MEMKSLMCHLGMAVFPDDDCSSGHIQKGKLDFIIILE